MTLSITSGCLPAFLRPSVSRTCPAPEAVGVCHRTMDEAATSGFDAACLDSPPLVC